jgi:hypothetical protein
MHTQQPQPLVGGMEGNAEQLSTQKGRQSSVSWVSIQEVLSGSRLCLLPRGVPGTVGDWEWLSEAWSKRKSGVINSQISIF